jgi:hypothetical protein
VTANRDLTASWSVRNVAAGARLRVPKTSSALVMAISPRPVSTAIEGVMVDADGHRSLRDDVSSCCFDWPTSA